jgi:acyl carrier protein
MRRRTAGNPHSDRYWSRYWPFIGRVEWNSPCMTASKFVNRAANLRAALGYWRVAKVLGIFVVETRVDRNEIKLIVREYIAGQFLPGEDPESLTDEVRLVSDAILDSLASLKLVSFLEERFGISVEAHEVDIDHLDTLSLVTDLVLSKRA